MEVRTRSRVYMAMQFSSGVQGGRSCALMFRCAYLTVRPRVIWLFCFILALLEKCVTVSKRQSTFEALLVASTRLFIDKNAIEMDVLIRTWQYRRYTVQVWPNYPCLKIQLSVQRYAIIVSKKIQWQKLLNSKYVGVHKCSQVFNYYSQDNLMTPQK